MGWGVSDPLLDPRDDAATPLTPDERNGLLLTHITTRGELNEAEALNIAEADDWAFRRKRDVLDEAFLRALHRRMFAKVWRWAGAWSRERDRRIGVDYWLIQPELHDLIDTARYWIENGVYPADEIALRFHHKLTWIHPFPNGNGRFARTAADLLAVRLGRERFSWGGAGLVRPEETRARYVAALRAADGNDFEPLFVFARS